eukprot:GHVR01009919.1.p1 GENE.GHVR01009919.1~~GHVR01009919.1.p1  ORF type:complete len:246 (+),score=61.79 GHVR01009919.1:95-832(+)
MIEKDIKTDNNIDIVNKDIPNKDIVNKDIINKDIVNKDIVNKDIVNKDNIIYIDKDKDILNNKLNEEIRKSEITTIDNQLKEWFIKRSIDMQRNMTMWNKFKSVNISTLSTTCTDMPLPHRVQWEDIVYGKPQLEDQLSIDARKRKADRYLEMFTQSTDLSHPCRMPGVGFLRCLTRHHEGSSEERNENCLHEFAAFDACRSGLKMQEKASIAHSSNVQELNDKRAKRLFERRCHLLNTLQGEKI